MTTPKTIEEVVAEFEEVGLVLVDEDSEGIKTYIGGASEEQITWLRTTLITTAQRVREETIEEAIKYIEDARQEHNDARHGTSTDDAYDRACDAVDLLSTLNK